MSYLKNQWHDNYSMTIPGWIASDKNNIVMYPRTCVQYVCKYVYAHVHAHTHARVGARVCARTHTRMYVCAIFWWVVQTEFEEKNIWLGANSNNTLSLVRQQVKAIDDRLIRGEAQ